MKLKKLISLSLAITTVFTATLSSSTSIFADNVDVEETDEIQSFTLSLLFDEPLAQLEEDDTEDSDEYAIAPIWKSDEHASMLKTIINTYGTKEFKDNLSIIQTGATEADSLMQTDKAYPCKYLHGTENYVATLRFLKRFAKRLGAGDSLDTAKNTALSNLPAGLQKDMKAPLGRIADCIKEKHSGYSTTKKKCYVIGLACHLISDTYAHRMIVPTSAINDNQSTSTTSMVGKSDFTDKPSITTFDDAKLKELAKESTKEMAKDENAKYKNWQYFSRTVKLGVMEFRDIKNYMKSSVSKGKYEDDKTFCKKRYNNAVDVVEDFINTFSYDFDPSILIPIYGLKLNNLKGYIKDLGMSTSFLTQSEWNTYSTSAEV